MNFDLSSYPLPFVNEVQKLTGAGYHLEHAFARTINGTPCFKAMLRRDLQYKTVFYGSHLSDPVVRELLAEEIATYRDAFGSDWMDYI